MRCNWRACVRQGAWRLTRLRACWWVLARAIVVCLASSRRWQPCRTLAAKGAGRQLRAARLASSALGGEWLGLLKRVSQAAAFSRRRDPALCLGAKITEAESQAPTRARRRDSSSRCRGTRGGLEKARNDRFYCSRARSKQRLAPENTALLPAYAVAACAQQEHPSRRPSPRARRQSTEHRWTPRRVM